MYDLCFVCFTGATRVQPVLLQMPFHYVNASAFLSTYRYTYRCRYRYG